MDIVIRPIKITDVEDFHDALDSVCREIEYLGFIKAPTVIQTRAFIENNIRKNYLQMVAVIDEKLAGWIDIIPIEIEGFKHCGRLGMGVIRQFRRKGVGEALIREALNKVSHYGIERIELEVFSNNIPAISLYKKYNFKLEGRKINARKIGGKYYNIDVMALFLNGK